MIKLTMSPPAVVPDGDLLATEIFGAPPQGRATIRESEHARLVSLEQEIRRRLEKPVIYSLYPHRVGRRCCISLHLGDAQGKTLDILLTITGNISWPTEADYKSGIRWHICVPDATDMMWVLWNINRIAGEMGKG